MSSKLYKEWYLRNGFTLTEIMFAVCILASAMIPIAGMMGHGFEGTRRDSRQIAAIQLCQSRLNQALAVPYGLLETTSNSISSGTTVLLTLGATAIDNTTYTVNLITEDKPVTFNYQSVNINHEDYDKDDPASWDFLTSASGSLKIDSAAKEVSISVVWQEKSRPQNVELTSYKADFTR